MKQKKKKTIRQILTDLLDADPIEILIWFMTMLALTAIGAGIAFATYYIFS